MWIATCLCFLSAWTHPATNIWKFGAAPGDTLPETPAGKRRYRFLTAAVGGRPDDFSAVEVWWTYAARSPGLLRFVLRSGRLRNSSGRSKA